CCRCSNALKNGKVPSLAVANHNYLGPVPAELQSLTVVEEAMIALCRAKCWIVQLREEDSEGGLPIAQREVKGHIIVYPQRPTAITTTLTPSVDEIITPICVIFVGFQPPTAEWLQHKAKPLIVRKEKVMAALSWLKVYNHLYRKVLIDHSVLANQPAETVLP
ncbi:hypothetical protein B0H17DRAFT_894390, partial [Mycena rosella]